MCRIGNALTTVAQPLFKDTRLQASLAITLTGAIAYNILRKTKPEWIDFTIEQGTRFAARILEDEEVPGGTVDLMLVFLKPPS